MQTSQRNKCTTSQITTKIPTQDRKGVNYANNEDIKLGCVIIVICFALFDFSNGFHDTANSVATCAGTRSMYMPTKILSFVFPSCLPPKNKISEEQREIKKERARTILTVLFAACFNFLSSFVASLHVANQISNVINISIFFSSHLFVPVGIICTYTTLISALFWNFLPGNLVYPLLLHMLWLARSWEAAWLWEEWKVWRIQLLNIVYGLLGSLIYAGGVALVSFCFGSRPRWRHNIEDCRA